MTLEFRVQHKPYGSQHCTIICHETIRMTRIARRLINLGPDD